MANTNGQVISGMMGNTQSKSMTPAEAASAGLGWVPEDHPLYGTKGFVGYQDPATQGPTTDTPPGVTGDPPQTTDPGKAVDVPPGTTGDPRQMLNDSGTSGTNGLIGDPRQMMDQSTGDNTPPAETNTVTGDPPQMRDTSTDTAAPTNTDTVPPGVIGDPPQMKDTSSDSGAGGWPPPPDPTTVHPPEEPPVGPPTGPGFPPPIQVPGQTRSPEKQTLIDQLMQRAQQGTAIDRFDPAVRAQADAYAAQEDRSRRNLLADQAEKGSPYNTGEQAGLERMTAEQSGQRIGQFEASLVNRELTARRDEIQQALTQWGSTLSDEEKQGLERDLQNMNAAIQQRQMGDQNSQFYAGLDQQDKQFYSQLQQGERFKNMDDALSRYQTATQNGQFFAKLAQDGDISKLQLELDKTKIGNDDKNFLLQLAQTGKYADLENAYKQAALKQDNNQFMAKLAQEGKIADMDDLFRKMQLAQQESQFLDRLGFDVDTSKADWDWKQRGNA